jgi:hypothetical protein
MSPSGKIEGKIGGAGREAGNKKKFFFSNRVVETWNMVPGVK